jgi:tetratricopeptide (TPR) repeat protein
MGRGRVDDARRFLDSVLSVHSDNTTAYLLLGELSFYEKKIADAIKYFQKAIDINPKLDSAYRSLVTIYSKEKNYDKAADIIRQGLSEMPGRPILVMLLASIYEQQGNFSKAIESYESLLTENPEFLVAKNNLASLLTDYVGDQASLEKARSISIELRDSRIPQFRDTYAWAAVKSGTNIEEAVVILEGIVKDNDQVDVYNYHLGEAYRKKGDMTNAIAYLKKAVELASPDSDIANQAKESLKQIN